MKLKYVDIHDIPAARNGKRDTSALIETFLKSGKEAAQVCYEDKYKNPVSFIASVRSLLGSMGKPARVIQRGKNIYLLKNEVVEDD